MKKFWWATALLILLCSGCDNNKKQSTYKAVYATVWPEIDSVIQKSWATTVGKCPSLPDTFVYTHWYSFQFYYHSYLTQKGLLLHHQDKLALGGLRNLLYMADSMGFVPNANISWGENRSQTPVLSQMVSDWFDYSGDTAFLRTALPALLTEYHFWTDTSRNAIEKHTTTIPGLQRFSNHASDREKFDFYNAELIARRNFPKDVDTNAKITASDHFMSEYEGIDITPRFENRCNDFVAVDLNSCLFIYEQNFARFEQLLGISDGSLWLQKAQARKELVNQYLWDKERKLYLNYDFKNKRMSRFAAYCTFFPMYAGIADSAQAAGIIENLPLFESDYGIIASEPCSEPYLLFYDQNVISPLYYPIVIEALDKYGYKTEARRIAMKYLDLVAKNYLSPEPPTFKMFDVDTFHRTPGKIYSRYFSNGSINDKGTASQSLWSYAAGAYSQAYHYVTISQ